MKKKSTYVEMIDKEAIEICKFGQGPPVCIFLVIGGGTGRSGFQCIRKEHPTSDTILKRFRAGEMVAEGKGGWKGCAWEGEI